MKKALTLLLLFTAFLGFSQNFYQQGYFINNDGAKTDCLIRNIGWKDSPTEFEYKLADGAEIQKATIKTVQKFSVSGYEYLRFTTDLDRSTNDVTRMSSKEAPEFAKETIFLKVLVDGKATLLHYEDSNLVRYFTSTDNNATAQQLVYKQYGVDGKVAYNYKFRGQLYDIMKDEIKDTERFKYLKYEKGALVKLFVEYNGTAGQESKNLTENQNKTTINFKITPGVSFSSLSVSQRSSLSRDYDFKDKAIFRIGLEVEAILPFNNNKWALFTDPNYQAYKNSGVDGHDSTWKIDFKYLEIPLGVRHYMYLNKNSKFFIDASYVLAVNLSKTKLEFMYSSTITDYGLDADVSKSTNIALGAGYSYKRISAEVRYGFNRQLLANYAAWTADYTSVSVIMGYKLF